MHPVKALKLARKHFNKELQALCHTLGKKSDSLLYVPYSQALGKEGSNEPPGLEMASPARLSIGRGFFNKA